MLYRLRKSSADGSEVRLFFVPLEAPCHSHEEDNCVWNLGAK